MDFFTLLDPAKVEEVIRDNFPQSSRHEPCSLVEGRNRYVARDYHAPENLPGFRRSQVDGYAVRASDTFGASGSLPAYLTLKGNLEVDENAKTLRISPGTCYRIATGGMLPEGADAAVMVEYTREAAEESVEIFKPVSPSENIVHEDEDLSRGEVIIRRGERIQPFHIGLLAGSGIQEVEVFSPLKIGIVATGDELIEVSEKAAPGKIRDVNSLTLTSLLVPLGTEIERYGIVKDRFESLHETVSAALSSSDMLLISGGSSVGVRDLTVRVLQSFEKTQILFHGLALKPGKPTIVAKVEEKPVVGLPGHVSSTIVSCLRVVIPLIRHFFHNHEDLQGIWLPAGESFFKTVGREEWIKAHIQHEKDQTMVYPVYSKSGVLGSFLYSDGFVVIPQHLEGVQKGQMCRFIPFHSLF